jgi:hypothetical protein
MKQKILIAPIPKDASEWMNYIYTHARGQHGHDDLIYHMDNMQYPELQSLISSGLIYAPNEDHNGYCMPKWVSNNITFSLYNRIFTILRIRRLFNHKTNELSCVRVTVDDIDDGDNDYDFATPSQEEATKLIEFFKSKYEANPVLDTAELLRDLTEKGFVRI